MRPTAVSAAGLVFLFFMVAFTGFHGIPTGSSVLAAVGEEEEDNTHKYAGEKGFRQGKVTKKSIEIVLDGKSVGELTEQDLTQLDEKQIYSPRGPKVGWRVMDAINGEGIKSGKAVHFLNGRGKRLDLEWADLQRQRDKVVLTYNFMGELVLETDVSDKVPDRELGVKGALSDAEEEAIRKEMHQSRQKSLIFLRNVAKIEIDSN